MMRGLVQPGPVSAARIEALRGLCRRVDFRLEPGLTLADAISRPLIAAGVRAATLRFAGVELEPFHYVMPGPPDGPAHVAYFSAPRAPAGAVRIDIANVTFGCVDGKVVLHCHAAWQEREAGRRGGHILLDQSVVVSAAAVTAWTFTDIGFRAEADPETNFTLLRPGRIGGGDPGRAVVARIRPNEDVCSAVETVAREHGMRDAVVRGSLGSLIGARFTDGREVGDCATEVLVRGGAVRDGVAAIDMVVVDMLGEVHEGRLVRGDNPVCITFDLVLEEDAEQGGGVGG
jgi:predicted DNA-binding protein with PD1-like motif